MLGGGNIVVLGGLLIGLVYGAVGLLSGFCLTQRLRSWWAKGDSRLVRSYALALGVAIVAARSSGARGVVDLGKSIYLQPSFSAPLMFFGGLLFGYGMVLANACGSRALVLLGRGNLRSLVVVIVLGSRRADDPERPDRAAADRSRCIGRRLTPPAHFVAGAAGAAPGISDRYARIVCGLRDQRRADHLRVRPCAVPRAWRTDRGRHRHRPAGRGGLVCHRLSRRRRFQSGAGGLADLRRADRRHPAICDVVDRPDLELRHRRDGRGVRRQPA